MKKIAVLFYALCLSVSLLSCRNNTPVNVLIISGGHDYDKENFDVMLGKLPIFYDHVKHPSFIFAITFLYVSRNYH